MIMDPFGVTLKTMRPSNYLICVGRETTRAINRDENSNTHIIKKKKNGLIESTYKTTLESTKT